MKPTPARDTVVTITDAAGHEVTLSGVDVEFTDTPDAQLVRVMDEGLDLDHHRRTLARVPTLTPEEAQHLRDQMSRMVGQVSRVSDKASEAPTAIVTITLPHGWDLAPRTHEHHPYRWPQPRGRRR